VANENKKDIQIFILRSLKAKTTAKLSSTEMDFWRRSARISRKDKIRNNVIKEKNERYKIPFR
jgi:hypothetical protein